MHIVTTAANSYLHIFSSYVNQFLQWGKWLFFSLLAINIVWLALWYAFDRHAITETLPSFLKRFFMMAFFYTLMIHPAWLGSLLHTANAMGNNVVHALIDPSSLIAQGIRLGNQLMVPVSHSSLLTAGLGMCIVLVVYIVVVFVFISIALDLALTLIITTALISMAAFFLGFAALNATQHIARQTLDVILANCVKLLGIYLVVAAGSQTMASVATTIPTEMTSLEPYAWIVAVALLFWLLAKNLPNQLAKMVSGAITDTQGVDATALLMATSQLSKVAVGLVNVVTPFLKETGKLAGSTAYNAFQQFKKATMETGNPVMGLGTAIGGTAKQFSQSVVDNISDHAKNIANRSAGGPGSQQPISSVSSRMYQAAKTLQAKTGDSV